MPTAAIYTEYNAIRSGITHEKAGNLPFSHVENDLHESKSLARSSRV